MTESGCPFQGKPEYKPEATRKADPGRRRRMLRSYPMSTDHGHRPVLRLVWSRPTALTAPRKVNLAQAIERHLAGGDGLTDQQFAMLHATGRLPLGFPAAPARP